MDKKQFIKIYKELKKLDKRNGRYDKFVNMEIYDDFRSNFANMLCSSYETLILKTLSLFWKESEIVHDWITYCYYEEYGKQSKNNVSTENKEYTVNNAETLANFLFTEYELI